MSNVKLSKYAFLNIFEEVLCNNLNKKGEAWFTIDVKPNPSFTKWIDEYITEWNNENGSLEMSYNENEDEYEVFIDRSPMYVNIPKAFTNEIIVMRDSDLKNLFKQVDDEYKDVTETNEIPTHYKLVDEYAWESVDTNTEPEYKGWTCYQVDPFGCAGFITDGKRLVKFTQVCTVKKFEELTNYNLTEDNKTLTLQKKRRYQKRPTVAKA